MNDHHPESDWVPDEGAAGGLILVSVLCLVGLALLLLWMSAWSNTARPLTGPAVPGDWTELVTVLAIGLDLFAVLGVFLGLTHSSWAPAVRWVFGAGLLAMLLAISGAAFIGNDLFLFEARMRNPVKHCSGAAIASAARLLALGTLGLLLAAAAATLHRRDRTPEVRIGAAAVTVLLGLGCLAMTTISATWIAWSRTYGGKLKVGSFRSAAMSLAAPAAVAILVLLLVPHLSKLLRNSRDRIMGWMPGTGILGLVLLGPAWWSIASDQRIFPAVRMGGVPSFTLNGTPFLAGREFLVFTGSVIGLVLFEFIDRIGLRNEDRPGGRARVAISFIGWLAAGTAILSVVGTVESVVDVVLGEGRNLTHRDGTMFLGAAGAMSALVPVFLVARLLGAERPGETSDRYRATQKAALLILTTGALGFALAFFGFQGEVGELGSPATWLRAGAIVLRWSTMAFLLVATVNAVREFAARPTP